MTNTVDASTLADALGISKRAVQRRARSWPYLEVPSRGGKKRVYPIETLPEDVRVKLAVITSAAQSKRISAESWSSYEHVTDRLREIAKRRLPVVLALRRAIESGLKVTIAMNAVAREHGVPVSTIKKWWYGNANRPGVAKVEPPDYLPTLIPSYRGHRPRAEITPEAWDAIVSDYLRPEKPTLRSCYERLLRAARQQGWVVPSYWTVRRMIRLIPWQVISLARDGREVLLRKLGSQKRTREHLRPLEAVNADGHVFDVRVTFPDGRVGRPAIVAFSDVFSGMILSWRIGETINSHLVRLAFGDLLERFGIPEHLYIDNGREFAAKALTGGVKNRYRFQVREEDPIGLFVQLGVEVHWTTPYHGQSKPIERAFREFCDRIAKHPLARGAYTGNAPHSKPENYGERAMEWADFCRLVETEIKYYNEKPGRRTETAKGRSFLQTFAEAYKEVRRPSPTQRRMWLMAAEGVRVRKDGFVSLFGNAYFAEFLPPLAGKRVVVRFDPERLDQPISVYESNGRYLGEAQRIVARFDDLQAARRLQQARRQRLRAIRAELEATRRVEAIEALVSNPEQSPIPRPKVIRMIPRKIAKQEPIKEFVGEYVASLDRAVLRALKPRTPYEDA